MFLKNTAGQVVQAQMTTLADGSEFTGSVVCYVTGDGGTQALGSVGSGACTHEGHGLFSYAPAQAETNYETVSYTFVGTGAGTVSVHLNPDTVKADVATVDANVDAILDDTGTSGVVVNAASGAAAVWNADRSTYQAADSFGEHVQTNLASATQASTIDTVVDAIKVKTDFLPSATAGAAGGVFIAGANAATTVDITGSLSGSVGSVAASVAINASSVQAIRVELEDPANMMAAIQTAIADIPTNAEFAAAFPTNFAALAITVGGAVTVGTNSDKTGYALTQSFPTNFASMSIDANGRLDIIKVAGTTQTAGDIYGAVPGLVWDIVLSSHLTAGSTGAGLNAASSAGDPWSTALPGAYGAGSAGKIMSDALTSHTPQSGDSYARIGANGASLTALATQASVDTIDTNVDAILADTGTAGVVVDGASVRNALGLNLANLDTQLADLPTVAEFNARTLAAASYLQSGTAFQVVVNPGSGNETMGTMTLTNQ